MEKLILLLPTFRSYLQRPFRLLLMLFSVALGSGMCTFILMMNQSTMQSLRSSVEDLAGETDLTILSTGGESFSESVLDQVLKIKGIASAVPVIQNQAFLVLKNGQQRSMTLLGIDLLNDSSVRNYGNEDSRIISDPLAFMADASNVALTQQFADEQGFQAEETVQFVTAQGIQNLKIKALIHSKGTAKAFGGTLVIMDIEAARMSFGKAGKLDQINIKVEDPAAVDQIKKLTQETLGDSFSVAPPSSQVASLKEIVEPFQKMMMFLGGITFVMAFFLIAHISQVAFVERRREIGILRSLGMTRYQILAQTLFEYVLIALVGAMIGCFGAWILANLFSETVMKNIAAQTQISLNANSGLIDIQIPMMVMAGTILCMLAAVLFSAWSATKISPVEAFSVQTKNQQTPAVSLKKTIFKSAVGLGLMLPLFFNLEQSNVIFHLLPLFGAALLSPIVTVLFLKGIKQISGFLQSPLLKLAWEYCTNQPDRVEKTIRGLIIAMLLIFVISTTQQGFMSSLDGRFINTSRPDFYVSSNGDFLSPMTLQPIEDSLQQELAKVEGVAGVYGQRVVSIPYKNRKIKLRAFDEVPPSTLEVPYSYFEVVDRPVSEAGQELYHNETNSVIVSESFVSLFGQKTGDEVELNVLGQNLKFKIVGVLRDFTDGGGAIYISRPRYKKIWQDSLVTGIAIVLEKQASEDVVKTAIENQFGKSHGLMVTIDRTIKNEVTKILNRSFYSLYLMQIVCVIVASLGFMSSFFIEVQNRQQEIAVFRVTGMSRKELSMFLMIEAALIGTVSALVTLILAVPVSWGLITKSMGSLLGWVVEFKISAAGCLALLLIGFGISLISSLYAIRSALKMNVTEVLNAE